MIIIIAIASIYLVCIIGNYIAFDDNDVRRKNISKINKIFLALSLLTIFFIYEIYAYFNEKISPLGIIGFLVFYILPICLGVYKLSKGKTKDGLGFIIFGSLLILWAINS